MDTDSTCNDKGGEIVMKKIFTTILIAPFIPLILILALIFDYWDAHDKRNRMRGK